MARKTNFNVNGYNYYKVTKTIGHKENREPIKKVFYGSSKSEAEQKAIDYIQNLKLGLLHFPTISTFLSIQQLRILLNS